MTGSRFPFWGLPTGGPSALLDSTLVLLTTSTLLLSKNSVLLTKNGHNLDLTHVWCEYQFPAGFGQTSKIAYVRLILSWFPHVKSQNGLISHHTYRQMFCIVMCKMRKGLGLKMFYSRLDTTEHLIRLNNYKTFNNDTSWFCILKSLQNVHKSPHKLPKSCIWDIFSFLGFTKKKLFVPLPSPTEGNPPYFKWPYSHRFSFQKWKKTISEVKTR